MRPLVATVLLLLAGPASANIELQLVASNVPHIVDIQHANDSRLFLVSQAGTIRIWNGSAVLATPFLDLTASVRFSGEQGLLGLAFHPDYASNGFFYVNYIDTSGDTVIARYRVSSDPNVADPASASLVLAVEQPFSNHNGGQLRFGPDGYLYVALGDGGSGGDPQNHGQRLDSLLGKILRLDVSATPYAIPPTNPFTSTAGARGEIWSYGLRNPWRFSFDRTTGDMFIADVGQSEWEEISVEPANTGGRNYGWRLMEGMHCFNPSTNCNDGSLTLPVIEYSHDFGCSVTGGFRYRGSGMPAYVGAVFYGDFCTGRVWSATRNSDGTWTPVERLDTSHSIATFGEDSAGELYVAHYASSGQLYRIVQQGNGFTDDPLISGSTPVKGIHVEELRARIDALRAARSLSTFTWTDTALTSGATLVRAVHVAEMRQALDDVYTAAGVERPAYTDASLSSGAVIKAVHMTELRSAVVAVE